MGSYSLRNGCRYRVVVWEIFSVEGVPVGYNWSITAALTARAGGARVRLREAFEDNDNTSKINNENDNDIIHPAGLTRKLPFKMRV